MNSAVLLNVFNDSMFIIFRHGLPGAIGPVLGVSAFAVPMPEVFSRSDLVMHVRKESTYWI